MDITVVENIHCMLLRRWRFGRMSAASLPTRKQHQGQRSSLLWAGPAAERYQPGNTPNSRPALTGKLRCHMQKGLSFFWKMDFLILYQFCSKSTLNCFLNVIQKMVLRTTNILTMICRSQVYTWIGCPLRYLENLMVPCHR